MHETPLLLVRTVAAGARHAQRGEADAGDTAGYAVPTLPLNTMALHGGLRTPWSSHVTPLAELCCANTGDTVGYAVPTLPRPTARRLRQKS